MANILEYRRKSIKLRKQLKKRLQSNATQTFINQLNSKQINIPFAAEKWAHIISNFLTHKECDAFIDFLYNNHPTEKVHRLETAAKRILSSSEPMKPRGLAWTINKSDIISKLIYDRCYDYLPKIWQHETDNSIWEICGINNDIKSLKYSAGDVLCSHYDAPYIKSPNMRSFITTVLYLNDDFEGGCFQFVNSKNESMIHSIPIKKGSCLLFEHNTFHQGSAVINGTKYMIRFDILYKRVMTNSYRHKCKSCVWL